MEQGVVRNALHHTWVRLTLNLNRINSSFESFDPIQLMSQAASPRIDSIQLMAQAASPGIALIQLMTQLT